MSKIDKDLQDVGFTVNTKDLKKKSIQDLVGMINERHYLLEGVQKEFNQELIEGIHNATTNLVAYATAHKIVFDSKIVVDRINNIVTHIMQEHAMKTKKNTTAKKTVKQEPVKKGKKAEPKIEAHATERKGERRADEDRREAERRATEQAEAAKTKAPKAPAKTQKAVKSEPEAEKAACAPAEFKTPCGGIFDADPSSSCFGMCKDESPEDFELCMAHYKSALEQKTTKRRVAAKKTAEKKATGEKRPPKRYDRIGDGFGTSAHMINILLLEGATIEEIMETVPTEKTRVMGHLSGLKSGNSRRGPKVVIKDPGTKRYYLDFEEGEPVTYFTII